MTEKLQIYKCKICGNIVQVLISGEGNLVCCGEEMHLLPIQHDNNELGEKHNPKLEERNNEKFVSVKGHPMTQEHYIQFIQVQSKDRSKFYTQYFSPEQIPELNTGILKNEEINAVEYCNIHHLWGENF